MAGEIDALPACLSGTAPLPVRGSNRRHLSSAVAARQRAGSSSRKASGQFEPVGRSRAAGGPFEPVGRSRAAGRQFEPVTPRQQGSGSAVGAGEPWAAGQRVGSWSR